MEHEIPFQTFQPGKRAYLFRFSTFSGNFPVGRTEETFSIYCRTALSGNFDQMERIPGLRNAEYLWQGISQISPTVGIRNPSSTEGDWNPDPGILNQRRGIQNPGLFWIPLHGAKIEITQAFWPQAAFHQFNKSEARILHNTIHPLRLEKKETEQAAS